jgi:hypothetical protein
MVVLGIFFFTAFLALFAVAAVGFGLRLWWLRHKLRKTMDAEETQMDVEEAEYVVIEDAEIIEESTDRANKNKHRDHHEPS